VSTSAILLVGGYGAVGAHAARTLRALHPTLPLVIAGRRLEPAETLARTLGNARAITVDLARPDLGLDGDLAINAVPRAPAPPAAPRAAARRRRSRDPLGAVR
jgi:glutamyl-tRNA reductase